MLTGALGAGSLLGVILGIVKQVPRNVAHHLADVIQIQTIITGSDRQISLLETAAFAVMNHARNPVDAQQAVLDVQARMDRVVSNAVRRIEQLADPEFRDAR